MKTFSGFKKLLEACFLFLIAGIILECGKESKDMQTNTVVPSDTLAPVVSFTDPLNEDTGVSLATIVVASFNEALDSSASAATNFILKRDSVQVPGSVSIANGVAIFSPDSNLTPNTVYTAEIGPVTDMAGNQMTTPLLWTFKTGSFHDTTIPQVIHTFPRQGDTGVALNTSPTATFSEEMEVASITEKSFIVTQDTARIPGAVTFFEETAIFRPAASLSPNATYTATITIDAQDEAGNSVITPVVWTFKTGSIRDTVAPWVTYTFPRPADTGVALNINPLVTFSEVMDSTSITAMTFTLKQDTVQISGEVVYNGTTAIFTPDTTLSPTTAYTAAISMNARDLAGNQLKNAVTWTFKTGIKP
jgi:hypothetical protein